MMKKKFFKNVAAIFMASAMLVSCGSTSTEPTDTGSTETTQITSEPKESFVFGIDGDPSNNINPITASGRYDLMASKAMFSPLFVYHSADDIEYFLATEIIPSEDGTTYTVKLRDDVVWHDGEPFTADDVVFSYNTYITNPSANGYDVFQFDGNPLQVNKIDDYTVEFVFPYAIPYALEILSTEKFIVPEHIWAGETDFTTNEKNANPIGTGPYKFASYKEGDNLTLVKNEDYFLGEPNIDNVIFKIVLDPNSALVALQNGELDALSILPTDVAKLDPAQITCYPYTEDRIGYMSTILYRPNMDNEDYRKAIFYAIDKQSLIDATYVSEEYARNAHSFLPENANYFTEDGVETYTYDPAKSKEYLEKSGVTNPTVKIGYFANNPVYETQATLVQSYLTAAGFDCTIQSYDPTAMGNALMDQTADFDLFFSGYIMGLDPDNYATLFTTGGAYNYSGISDPEIDAAFAAGRAELDPEKRAQIYADLQKDFMDKAFFLPIAENKRIIAVNNRIGGVEEAGLVPVYGFQDMSKLYEQ